MTAWLPYVLPPLIGAVIGGVTNDVAIRMLFRPYQPLYLGKWRMPLTPGLIPREREHIAEAIAETFVAHVFGNDDVAELFLTDKVKEDLKARVDELIGKLGGMLDINETMLGMARTMAGGYLIAEIGKVAERAGDDSEAIKLRIQQKIDDLDVATLEELVLGFSRKQFRHITWFGVLLGFMIGVVQVLLFQFLL
ncbi:MAG: hypothetical protein DRQ60_01865 [Gammaproteobacteria bacterium]|nr:MAG: hypothetical protein DRQ54_04050 [Gammaproteobacteria bacterium]RLA13848.1 MAG: hypothetical protein DRQ52_05470 [Gammaproteobacteria bacterium]RLA17492.1 MAG: hypothetical protein DRQ60_01865 [Gammaproteobacteria bacterium]